MMSTATSRRARPLNRVTCELTAQTVATGVEVGADADEDAVAAAEGVAIVASAVTAGYRMAAPALKARSRETPLGHQKALLARALR
jgi:hypothetical protein